MSSIQNNASALSGVSPASRSTGDRITSGLAVFSAIASATFAGYMWASSPAEKTGGRLISEKITLSKDDETRTSASPIRPTVGDPLVPASSDPITTASTTSVSELALDQSRKTTTNSAIQLEEFVLLGIFADIALIAGTGSNSHQVWHAKVGSSLPGAGRIVALVIDDRKSAVLTTRGFITYTRSK